MTLYRVTAQSLEVLAVSAAPVRVTAQSLEVLSVSAANARVTAQSLEVLTGTYQIRLPKAYAMAVVGPKPDSVALQKSYGLAVIDDGSYATYDPYWSNVVLLAHCDGSNAGTVFTDSSPQAHVLTAQGNAQTSTAQFKFGTASALLDGTGDYIDTPDSDDWSFGTSPFTIEMWVRFNSVGTQIGLLGQYESGGPAATASWLFSRNTNLEFRTINAAGAATTVSSAWTPVTNTWYHLAVDRDSTQSIRIYVNGAVLVSGTNPNDVRNISTTPLRIGRSTGTAGTDLSGYIDDVRITKGIARYGGVAFAVPQAPYPDTGLVTGTGSATLGDLTSSATGSYTNSSATGTASGTLDTLTSAASGAFVALTTGTATSTLSGLTSDAAGTAIPPAITGTASATLSALTSAASGTVALPTVSGSAGALLDDLSSDGAAIHLAPVTGSSASFLEALSSAGDVIHIQPVIGVGETTLEGIPTAGIGEVFGVVTWPPPRVRKVYLQAQRGRTVSLNATVRGYSLNA